MPIYKAPIRDFKFAMNEWLEIEKYSEKISGLDDLSLIETIIDEGARFCEEVLFPINKTGDEDGLKFEDGEVTLAPGYKEAYQTYVESGWGSLACDTKYGGQGLPNIVNTPLIEMICSSNLSFGLFPGLTHGTYSALHIFGTDEQKNTYLPKLTTGEWSGIMCLTEPQSGTDLGLNTTKAIPNDDGSYNITGTKIFISCGEHDAAENIIGLVLARLPDAPAGIKGISLFVVPKFMINEDGTIGERNKVSCGGIEHKMGIHASPTCVMNYDGAIGWMVGEPNKGMQGMFTMMNEARFMVSMQGLGVGEVSYQNALDYSRERLQGRALNGDKFPDKKADPIYVHPDVRRMLLTMRSFTEGARILALWTALNLDLKNNGKDEREKRDADDFVQIVTPIIKSYLTEEGTKAANLAMQVFGGHGYIKEQGIEQYARDARICEIYEGTNGIQALDLVGRKMGAHTGRYLRAICHPIEEFITAHRETKEMEEFTKPLYQSLKSLQNASLWLGQKALANPDEAAGASVDYLKLFSLVTMGYIWAKSAYIALEKLKEDDSEKLFYESKIATARFFLNKILPEHYSLLAKITAGVKHLDIPDIEG